MRDFLLKLHYLGYEINEIYQVVRIYQKSHNMALALGSKYSQYLALNSECIKEELSKYNIRYLTIFDAFYPEKLLNIYMPPLVLFYQGDLTLLDNRVMAVIGSRANTTYGEKVTRYIVPQLVEHKFVIASGLAYGIDTIAHKSCLDSFGKTIAVLGSGIKEIYPKEHLSLAQEIGKNHLLISEYPPFEKPKKTHFPFRNRIVSGISNSILVIEAKAQSGTLITCDYALDQGKDIFVIPNQIFAEESAGTNNLIKQGAYLVSDVSDILANIRY
ncbi:MAG TPA: DNA-processing protein DprA [Haloplasmataceae bacterium]